MPEKIVDTLSTETKTLARHIFGEMATDALFGGRKERGSGVKDEKKMPSLSWQDNALVASVLASVAKKQQTAAGLDPDSRIQADAKFAALLAQAASEFQLVQNNPVLVWPRFLTFLGAHLPESIIKVLQQKAPHLLPAATGAMLFTAANQPVNLTSASPKLLKVLAWPFIRHVTMVESADHQAALQQLKSFCELADHDQRLTAYSHYLLELEEALTAFHDPRLLISSFFRHLYETADPAAKERLAQRTASAFKHLARHLSVLADEAPAIQWLGIPFVELIRCLAQKDPVKAEEFVASFCTLPDHTARVAFYMGIMPQPEHPIDLGFRMLDSATGVLGSILNKVEEGVRISERPDGVLGTIDRWHQAARRYYQES